MAEFLQTEEEKKEFLTRPMTQIHLTKTGSRSAEMYLPSRKKYETQIAKPFLIKN